MTRANAKIAKKFLVKGRVQGVGYRYFADRVASELGLFGYVKNLWDGNVEVYAIGESVAVEELKRQLAEGPRSARVTGVEESDAAVDKRYNRFAIEG
jgi:acylphosphatase